MMVKYTFYPKNPSISFLKILRFHPVLLCFCIVLSFSCYNLADHNIATATERPIPKAVIISISKTAADAFSEQTSESSTRFSRRAAATNFSSEVISALENYPTHADLIIDTAIKSGFMHRQYLASTILAVFPGHTSLVRTKLASYKSYIAANIDTTSPSKNKIRKDIKPVRSAHSEKKSNRNTQQFNSNWKNRIFRVSFEEIDMPTADEQMGLFGLGYYQHFYPWFYSGLTAFGAASGKRGGFFTGGFTSGLKIPLIQQLYADTSLYVGAGGGGDAPQGGGLMLRPYVGLFYNFGQYALGLGYSRVEFPSGDIDGDAISLQLDTNFLSATRDWFAPIGSAENYFNSSLSEASKHRSHISIRSRFYNPTDGSNKVSGTALVDTIGVVGINYAYFLNKHVFIDLESAGAFSGDVGGYAELLGGMGFRQELSENDRLAILPSLTIGGAGGGGVDTGGGFVTRANLGLEYRLTRDLSIIADGGYFGALNGNFEAPYAGFNIAYVTENLSLDKKGILLSPREKIFTAKWRIRPTHQWYFDAPRKNSVSKDMELLGAKFDWVPGNWWYLTGQALSAYAGGAGGYSEGLWGAGFLSPNIAGGNLFFEALIGAGGGGGVDTASALIAKAAGGLSYKILHNLSLEFSVGRLVSRQGNMDLNLLDAGLVYHLGSPLIKK